MINLCIHGHFYQPPREDPISNYIPDETGAEPYHNWNERILAECYKPNAKAGNFSKISFNIGPTLFNWMFEFAPTTANLIVAQERENYLKFGVGNGIAQGYNHSILPLATLQDKITQVHWGVEDFDFRFGHKPEGLWLPETAVDLETLCVLSDEGLKFTILAPWQIASKPGESGPYLIALPGGRTPMVVFNYDQDLSTQVSFVPSATVNGDEFLSNLVRAHAGKGDTLNLIASDGELYGHHQPLRNYFLRYLLNEGGELHEVAWNYPARWLKEHPVTSEAILQERTSWSCPHGVSRWAESCDCTPGVDWKAPLREVLTQIAEWVDQCYLDVTAPIFQDPWELRNEYIRVINKQITLEGLCEELAGERWNPAMLPGIDKILKSQFERQRMFTSCGFFFDEFHRIEPQNNISYAAKAVWLITQATGFDISPAIIDALKEIKSKKTGLRADTIFSQTLLRANAEKLD